ncbi:MAG: ATP phosphoribosyltransferase [Clostridiales bacterium GWB2_37_7]|nr:MAG: ATP phosphoribosyltransferase [Clostridiales bacterium GWB2_37_7]
MLKIALSKGRIASKVCGYLDKDERFKGTADLESRKLIFEDQSKRLQLILVKPSDLPLYVESGAVDMGIVGKDVLMEASFHVYETMDLKIGQCKMILAGLPNTKASEIRRVGTKYPQIALDYFSKKRIPVQIVKLDGSVELAPIVGLSDAIVDITETGSTLAENGLIIYDEICSISSRLIVNPVRYKTKYREISELEEFFKNIVKIQEGVK